MKSLINSVYNANYAPVNIINANPNEYIKVVL